MKETTMRYCQCSHPVFDTDEDECIMCGHVASPAQKGQRTRRRNIARRVAQEDRHARQLDELAKLQEQV